MIRILIADDHEVVRKGLRNLLRARPDWDVCGEACTGEEAVVEAERLRPDIVILDMVMPGLAGAAAARTLHARLPRTEILVFTMHEADELVAEVLSAGARGYVLKGDPSRYLLAAVEALAHHGSFVSPSVSDALSQKIGRRRASAEGPLLLTHREREVVRLLADGRPNRQIATDLGISVKTVESHRANVMRKLELHSVVDLVRYAVRNQLVQA
jgi:DNA-binding NarL/FixJ family response regulator